MQNQQIRIRLKAFDHRLIDGAMGGAFIERVADNLETMELG